MKWPPLHDDFPVNDIVAAVFTKAKGVLDVDYIPVETNETVLHLYDRIHLKYKNNAPLKSY